MPAYSKRQPKSRQDTQPGGPTPAAGRIDRVQEALREAEMYRAEARAAETARLEAKIASEPADSKRPGNVLHDTAAVRTRAAELLKWIDDHAFATEEKRFFKETDRPELADRLAEVFNAVKRAPAGTRAELASCVETVSEALLDEPGRAVPSLSAFSLAHRAIDDPQPEDLTAVEFTGPPERDELNAINRVCATRSAFDRLRAALTRLAGDATATGADRGAPDGGRTATGARPNGGRKGLSEPDRRKREKLLGEWDEAKRAGQSQKEFCDDMRVSVEYLAKCVNWRATRQRRTGVS